MAASYYYLLASLPHLGDLGGAAPVSAAELLDRVVSSDGPAELMEAVLLGDDLLQRDAVLAGETTEYEPVVLTKAQMADDEPLPSYLAGADDSPAPAVASDVVWGAYCRHVAAVGRKAGFAFLTAWVGHEVALRNSLAESRANALGLEPETYLVARDIEDPDANLTAVLNEWTGAPDPLAGLRVVDTARWQWLDENDAWFTFGADELVVYAARLMLLDRWRRLSQGVAGAGATTA